MRRSLRGELLAARRIPKSSDPSDLPVPTLLSSAGGFAAWRLSLSSSRIATGVTVDLAAVAARKEPQHAVPAPTRAAERRRGCDHQLLHASQGRRVPEHARADGPLAEHL